MVNKYTAWFEDFSPVMTEATDEIYGLLQDDMSGERVTISALRSHAEDNLRQRGVQLPHPTDISRVAVAVVARLNNAE